MRVICRPAPSQTGVTPKSRFYGVIERISPMRVSRKISLETRFALLASDENYFRFARNRGAIEDFQHSAFGSVLLSQNCGGI